MNAHSGPETRPTCYFPFRISSRIGARTARNLQSPLPMVIRLTKACGTSAGVCVCVYVCVCVCDSLGGLHLALSSP